ncbi:MAG TPA: hypothetical protein VK501_12080 [Baekduia sp.]|nr:hypothetical protein [Baekduia sp.]HMJ34648.1 hypothetical protein [Baekduia sp.]
MDRILGAAAHTSLIVAMTMLAITHNTMMACIQIQKGDTPAS